MSRSGSCSPPPVELLSELLPPETDQKRHWVVGLKSRLASLLDPDEGEEYWEGLMSFIGGKINRDELGQLISRLLEPVPGAVRLHNALLLSILYNTTRATIPPSTVRHSGWHKRRRDKDGAKLEDRDPRRRRLKAVVMAIGKRERQEVKALALIATRKELDRERDRQREKEQLDLVSFSGSLQSRGANIGEDGLPTALGEATSTAIEQEYLRCLQAPLCSESKLLPDVDSLQDRMSRIAYEAGLARGADAQVASLGVQAIEAHLKKLIASVVSLVRTNRSQGIQTSTRSQLAHLTNANAEAGPAIVINGSDANGDREPLTASPRPMDEHLPPQQDDEPLTAKDFEALFDLSPGLLAQAQVAAVEKLYAMAPCSEEESSSEDEDSEDGEDEMEVDPTGPTAAQLAPNGVRTSGKSLVRVGSKSSLKPVSRSRSSTGNGREQFLIDPSAIIVARGHPDVVHPRVGSTGLPSSTDGVTPVGQRKPSLSLSLNGNKSGPAPTDVALKNQLFPEDDDAATASGPTSAVDSAPVAGVVTHEVESSSEGESDAEGGQNEADKPSKPGRRLYEVVDSVALLDGVLD